MGVGKLEIKVIATYKTSNQHHDLFRSGILVGQWSTQYPFLFDRDDLRIARNQASIGYHYFEWLAAILLYHTTGWLSLNQKYQFKSHSRKRRILSKLTTVEVFHFITSKGRETVIQCPDLLVYRPDYSDWYFCEVKGPKDRLRPQQERFFEELQKFTEKDIRFVEFEEFRSPSTAT